MVSTRAQCKAVEARHDGSTAHPPLLRGKGGNARELPDRNHDSTAQLKATLQQDNNITAQLKVDSRSDDDSIVGSHAARKQASDATAPSKVVPKPDDASTALAQRTPREKGDAAREVADIYELVEQILLHLRSLSPRSSLRAEAVSKTFQHVLKRPAHLRPGLRVPGKDALQGETEKDDDGYDCAVEHFRLLPSAFTFLQVARRDLSVDAPELSLTGCIPHFRMTSEKWRKPGGWRSWLLLRPTTKYIQLVHVRGNGRWTPQGLNRNRSGGWWDFDLSYRSETAITLGDLVDMVYELKYFSGGVVTVDFDLAVNEDGFGKRHWVYAKDLVDSEDADAVEGQVPVEFPEYHEVMTAACMLKRAWEGVSD